MKILLAGGGTGGPAAPLLAVAQEIHQQDNSAEFLFVGTKQGPERALIESAGFAFRSIAAGKLRRYFSVRNFLDIFVFIHSLFAAYSILSRFRPDVIFSVGGFVAVPLAWVGTYMKIKIVIHQQDVYPGLANSMIASRASVITATFRESMDYFTKINSKARLELTGNPVREEFFNAQLPHQQFFKLHDRLPILLITGGGTGAQQINEVVAGAIQELVKSHQVVHITGSGKNNAVFKHSDYHVYDFLNEQMPTALKMADMVVSRAGLSSISELSALGKVAIVVPMPASHQEGNAEILKQRKAAVVLYKDEFTPENLIQTVTKLASDPQRQKQISENISQLMPKDAAKKLAQIIVDLVHGN